VIEIHCPSDGSTLHVPDALAGLSVRCPSCQRLMRVGAGLRFGPDAWDTSASSHAMLACLLTDFAPISRRKLLLYAKAAGLPDDSRILERSRDTLAEAHLLRDIFGNPFRPVRLDPRWLTSTVVELAQLIEAGRAYDRLPVLADALLDAGCDDESLLDHCRSAGPHVPGCWAVELVLGRVWPSHGPSTKQGGK
jgi:hypothetical protein